MCICHLPSPTDAINLGQPFAFSTFILWTLVLSPPPGALRPPLPLSPAWPWSKGAAAAAESGEGGREAGSEQLMFPQP